MSLDLNLLICMDFIVVEWFIFQTHCVCVQNNVTAVVLSILFLCQKLYKFDLQAICFFRVSVPVRTVFIRFIYRFKND